LDQAASIVERRRREYGEPVEMFDEIAKRWSSLFQVNVTAALVVLALLDVKLVRLGRNPKHLDSIVDLPATPPSCMRSRAMREQRSCLGHHQAFDPETEKRTGWCEHGILVVAEHDPRLTWPERELVRQLGARLYGHRRHAPDG
jgi:hypothetical protein